MYLKRDVLLIGFLGAAGLWKRLNKRYAALESRTPSKSAAIKDDSSGDTTDIVSST